MTRSHLPLQSPAIAEPAECPPAEDYGSNAARAETAGAYDEATVLGVASESQGVKHEADGVKGSAEAEGSVSVLDDGIAGNGALTGKASGKTEDGLSFDGSMALGGGLVARAHAVETPDPDALLVVVTLGASASAGLSTSGGQDSASLGLEAGISGSATSTLGRVVPRSEAGTLLEAWAGGDLGPWFEVFGAMAAIGRFAADAEDVRVSDLNPGEFHRRTSAVDARVCLPAAWRGASVSAGASHHGERKATVEALPDGTLAVEVAFDTTVTRKLDGSLTVGELALGASIGDESRAGITVAFAFDRATQSDLAERALAVANAADLERVADDLSGAVVDRTVRTGEGTTLSPEVGVPGVSIRTRYAQSRDETVSVGRDGIDGTSFEGESSAGVGIAVAGQEIVGTAAGSAFDANVEDGEITAQVRHTQTDTAVGPPCFGITPKASWPKSLVDALVHSTERLFALDLTERDLEQIVRVRPLNVGAWDQCGFGVGMAAGQAWIALGESLRSLDPPDDWVAATTPRLATLAAGARLLADFAASDDSSWKAFYAVTRRFGVAGGDGDAYEALGTIAYWPPGSEALQARYEAAMKAKATLPEDLEVAAADGDADAGRELHHAIALPLNAITVAMSNLPCDDIPGRAWQSGMLEQLAEIRSEVELEYATFQRRLGCEPEANEDLVSGAVDGEGREAFVLLGTMRSYQKLEKGIYDQYRGRHESLSEFQRAIQPLHKPWAALWRRWRALEPDADEAAAATPDWEGYEIVLRATSTELMTPDYRGLTATARAEWGL